MKNILLAMMCFSAFTTYTQTKKGKWVPDYHPDEVIVRIRPDLLNHDLIDHPGYTKAPLHAFLNNAGKKEMAKLNNKPVEIPKLKVRKLFPRLSVCDTISISRTGDKVHVPPFWATFSVEKPPFLDYGEFLELLKAVKPAVVYAHPNFRLETNSLPNDSLFSEQHALFSNTYPLGSIQADSAWLIETGKPFIKAGVFDTGIDSTHPDLKLLTGYGYYVSNEPQWGIDYLGHGTAVAGIIAARRNNTTGIAGIAGGDGSDSSGISLIDFKWAEYLDGHSVDISHLSAGIIDAARSVGSYHNWQFPVVSACALGFPGYGIHIGNHSYGFKYVFATALPEDSVTWVPDIKTQSCDLCYESFLFSLQNGVVNVVARGNSIMGLEPMEGSPNDYPNNYPDPWVISVGASGYDGEWMYGQNNANGNAIDLTWYSVIGRDLDLIAPGNLSTVVSTSSYYDKADPSHIGYRRFNGTSAAAPHVVGVAALLLSHYNKPCYSNTNLDPADVEYILQGSASDRNVSGYDDTTGWGLLNAHKALQMVQWPQHQYVHPTAPPIQQQTVRIDTIHLRVGKALSVQSGEYSGPIGSAFPLIQDAYYQAERHLVRLTYDYSQYLLPTTELRALYLRHSRTNSLGFVADSSGHEEPIGTTQYTHWVTTAETLDHQPWAEIIEVDSLNGTVTMEGYYYHFIREYINKAFDNNFINYDFWYPSSPSFSRMPYSIHLYDANFSSRYDFPCDSANLLLDSNLTVSALQSDQYAFWLYPNPGHEQLTVAVKHPGSGKNTVRLMGMQGNVLQEQNLLHSQKKLSFDTATLAPGCYFVQWQTDQGVSLTRKWIKQ